MSGGFYDYWQYHIDEIAEKVKEVITKNHVEVPKEKLDSWCIDDNGKVKEWYKYYHDYNQETIEKFKEGYKKLKEAYIYAQRIDWLLSGDDGEETFHKRLKEDLDELEANFKNEKWLYKPE